MLRKTLTQRFCQHINIPELVEAVQQVKEGRLALATESCSRALEIMQFVKLNTPDN